MESINIKGKEYIPVNERIKEFWKRYPDGNIVTEIISNENGVCVFKATIYVNGAIAATGHAYEKETSSFINKTSYIENCETSAVGRALGILGIGIDTSIASYDEVATAVENQQKIDNTKVQALEMALENNNISGNRITEVLNKFGYKKITDILVIDYKKVCDEFKEAK